MSDENVEPQEPQEPKKPAGKSSPSRLAAAQRYYLRNRGEVAKRRKHSRKLVATKVRRILRDRGCQDCPEDDPDVLDFDHVRGEKKSTVSRMVSRGYAWATIEEEIGKCEVRCSNCHRRRHTLERKMQSRQDTP